MKYGARNSIKATVTAVQKGEIMSLAKFEAIGPVNLAAVLTTESVGELELAPGDQVRLVIKAIHVLPVKE